MRDGGAGACTADSAVTLRASGEGAGWKRKTRRAARFSVERAA
jgi:hypothetical protein